MNRPEAINAFLLGIGSKVTLSVVHSTTIGSWVLARCVCSTGSYGCAGFFFFLFFAVFSFCCCCSNVLCPEQVIAYDAKPHEQGFRDLFVETGQESHGRYCVRFFKDAAPVRVYIDDHIPCDASGQPLFAHSDQREEIWFA